MDEKWRKGAWDSREEELLSQGVQEFGYRWAAPIPGPFVFNAENPVE